jgi:hypothetical protein
MHHPPRRRKKLAPKIKVSFKFRPELVEMLRLGAAYHDVPYQTYTQWLLEHAVKSEALYYGWRPLETRVVLKPESTVAEDKIHKQAQQIMRASRNTLRKKEPF